jgi:hypothetical protein
MQRTLTVTQTGLLDWARAVDLRWGSRPKLHGMQVVGAMIGLVLAARPILSSSRRTGAPNLYRLPGWCRSVVPTRRISFGDFVRWTKP